MNAKEVALKCAEMCDQADKSTHPAELADAIRAFAATLPDEGESVVVPREATNEMCEAGMEASLLGRPSVDDESYVLSIYSAMLSAAPAQEPVAEWTCAYNGRVRKPCVMCDCAMQAAKGEK